MTEGAITLAGEARAARAGAEGAEDRAEARRHERVTDLVARRRVAAARRLAERTRAARAAAKVAAWATAAD